MKAAPGMPSLPTAPPGLLRACLIVVFVVASAAAGCAKRSAAVQEQVGAAGAAVPDAGDAGQVVFDAAELESDALATEDSSDACYRDPYLPNHYVPPCEQPAAEPHCDQGWCAIEPGCFIMGSPWCEWGRAKWSTDPVQVTLTHRFAIQQYELTQAEWTALELPNPSGLMANGTGDCNLPECPVGNITWMEALAFANLLSTKEGLPTCYELEQCSGDLGNGMLCDVARTTGGSVYDCEGYRLATGAEWEYAARAGTKTSVYSGEVVEHALPFECFDDPVLSPIAWYCANAGSTTQPVGQKQPNAWGLHDMIGNAAEWVTSDGVHGYGSGPYVDPWASFAFEKLLSNHQIEVQSRGGGFNQWPNTLRAAKVGAAPAIGKGPSGGVRLARTLPGAGP